jgi:hypothetical protein
VQFESAAEDLSTPVRLFCPNPPDIQAELVIRMYREKIVQGLVLGRYTQGGQHVIETLIHYFAVEHFYQKDADIGIWLVLGLIINIAMRMGCHRNSKTQCTFSVPSITGYTAT